jgi:hypothetical protein
VCISAAEEGAGRGEGQKRFNRKIQIKRATPTLTFDLLVDVSVVRLVVDVDKPIVGVLLVASDLLQQAGEHDAGAAANTTGKAGFNPA